MNQPWVGRFDDPTIKMVNFIKGNVSVTDDTGRDYFAEFEEKVKEENAARDKEVAELNPTFSGFPRVTVRVIEARNLMNADSSGFSNAYVVAGFLDKRAKSRVEKRTLDPRWDFEHEFELDESAYNELELSVWDSTLGAGRDVFLGVIHFDIYALQQAQKILDQGTQWVPLRPRKWGEEVRGDLLIELKKTGVPLKPAHPFRIRAIDAFDLELTVEQARERLSDADKLLYDTLSKQLVRGEALFDALKNSSADFTSSLTTSRGSTYSKGPKSSSKRKQKQINRLLKDSKAGLASSLDGDASISVSISMVDSPRFDTPRALDDGTSISDVLPEEVIYRIFSFLNALDRVRVSRVNSDWYRILKDEGLKSPAVEIIELTTRALSESDPVAQSNLVVLACERLKVTLLNIRYLVDWEHDFARQLSPFPLLNKNSVTVCDSLAIIDLILRALRLGVLIDQWKKTLSTLAPNFVQTFKFFENNYKAVFVGSKALTSDELTAISQPSFITHCTEWFETTSHHVIFGHANGLCTSYNAAAQLILVMKITLEMLKKRRFTTTAEIESIMTIVGGSLVLIALSGVWQQTKKFFKIDSKKIFRSLQEFEAHFPSWVIAGLSQSTLVTEKHIAGIIQ